MNNKIKLAVKKDTSGTNPLAGFHYMLHPMKMTNDREAAIFELMGYVIIEVEEQMGMDMLKAACAALSHQVSVAFLCEKAIQETTTNKLVERQ